MTFDELLDSLLGPTGIPDRVRAVNSLFNPVEGVKGSMQASRTLFAPETSGMGRVEAAGNMLSGMAGVVAPAVAASRAGVPAANALADTLTGLNTGAADVGRAVVARANQPGELGTLGSNGGNFFRAYHGSPHSFDRFSMDKIGTGEGAQAYGHGLYFADSEAVARNYRDNLSGDFRLELGGKPIHDGAQWFADGLTNPERTAAARLSAITANNKGDIAASLDEALGLIDEAQAVAAKSGNFEVFSNLQQQRTALLRWKDDGISTPGSAGSMYEVQINADPETFLDWDKPLSEQAALVEALAKSRSKYAREVASDPQILAPTREIYGRDIGPMTGQDLYKRLSYALDGRPGSAKSNAPLQKAGIPGIRYLDAGSRAAGDGSRNYVVFDDALIEILRKYGLAGVGLGGAAATGNALAPSQNRHPYD